MVEDVGEFEEASIYIEPSPVAAITDEDSADEDEGGHIQTSTETNFLLDLVFLFWCRESVPTFNISKSAKKAWNIIREWNKSDLKCAHKEQFKWDSQPADTSRLPVSQAELYGIFFDDDILEMVVENRFLYAYSKGNT